MFRVGMNATPKPSNPRFAGVPIPNATPKPDAYDDAFDLYQK